MLRQVFNLQSKKCSAESQKWVLPSTTAVRLYSKHTEGKQLGGYEHKEVSGFQSKWRTPIAEREGFWMTKLDLFASKSFPGNLTRFNPDNFKLMSFRRWWNSKSIEKLVDNQRFVKERLLVLGSELSAAHFVVFRGGAVKFYNNDKWIKDDKQKKEYDEELPNTYDPGYILESIDMSGTQIVYEGLQNIESLSKLKWLSFAQCPFFDSWCLDRVSGEHFENLEYLDISYTRVTSHGLNALYRFKNLKTLKADGFSEDLEFLLQCLELKKYDPHLNIEGISFDILNDLEEKQEKPMVS